jgi:hypothetical protein
MYGVNASIPKTLVRHMWVYAAGIAKEKILSEVLFDILDTPVSPELLPPTRRNFTEDRGAGGALRPSRLSSCITSCAGIFPFKKYIISHSAPLTASSVTR